MPRLSTLKPQWDLHAVHQEACGFHRGIGIDMRELPALVDDVLLPPYRPAEVLARLALISDRRSSEAVEVVRVRDMELDLAARPVRIAGATLESLTPREYDLLAFLATHRDKVFMRDRLLSHVWGPLYGGRSRTVDIHVRRLRAKLPPPYDDLVQTVHCVGYRLRSPT